MSKTAYKWSVALLFLLGTTLLLKLYALYVPYGIRIVYTDSIPTGIYASEVYSGGALQRDQGVCFHPEPKGWLAERHYFESSESICKYALGLPGDVVRPIGTEIFICHANKCNSAGHVMAADRQGRPSVPAFTAETAIPAGHYYLGSTYNPRSLDSRYLGLVRAEQVAVRTWPLLTF